MAEGSAVADKPECAAAPASGLSRVESLFHRRIEFHPARKPYSSFSSSDGDFRLETLNPSLGLDRPAVSRGGAFQAGAPSPGKRSGEREFYEHRMDPELSFSITFRRIGAGLANLGNTCFLNSVLQCLTYTEPFAAYLQSGKHKSSCHTAGFCAMCALQNHVITALQSNGKILSPSHLVKNLRCISRNFRNSRQEDAHEYMVNLLESMHKCCLPSGVPSESPGAYEKSLVHKIFGGHLRSQVKCTQCSYSSSKFDPFVDLSLEIAKADSLWKALTHFTAVEQLDGGERQYQCQHCKEKVRALKQLTIHKAPYVLTIHLKRFSSYVPGQKIDKKVDFEPTLDLKPFLSDQHGGDVKYTLYGVLVHAGWSTHSGHYFCYVRTSSGMWHSLDDNQVGQVSEKTVLAQKAYMLFYVRDRTSLPKGSVNMVHKDNISASATERKLIPESSLALNGAVKNCVRTCSTNVQSGSVKDTLSLHPLPQAILTLQKSKTPTLNEVPEVQIDREAIGRETSTLQPDGDSLPEGLQQTTSTSVTLQVMRKDFMVEEAKATCRIDATFILGSHQSDDERCQISGSTNGEVKSVGVIAVLNNSSCTRPKSQKHENKLLKERHMAKDNDAEKGILQTHDMLCNAVNGIPEENRKIKLLNGFTRKEANGRAPVGNLTTHHNEWCSSSMLSHVENVHKQEKPRLVNLPKRLDTANSFVQEDTFKDDSRIDNLKLLKPKKIAKRPLRGICFGRNHIFFASLNLHKIKKVRKSKKQPSSYKILLKDIPDDINTNDLAASTSEATVREHCHEKHCRSGLVEDNNSKMVKSGNYCNGESLSSTNRGDKLKNTNKNVTLDNFGLPRSCLSSAEKLLSSRVTYTDDKGIHHDFMNLLMGELKETTVSRWDDVELPKLELNGPESSRNTSIGYVLDEWDEEYDQGKRKKLRKSQQSFGGPNPFQETANVKAHQKLNSELGQTKRGNQPLRI
ncbi:unnamed protein product [Musa acuminata subsp. burmannicoides]